MKRNIIFIMILTLILGQVRCIYASDLSVVDEKMYAAAETSEPPADENIEDLQNNEEIENAAGTDTIPETENSAAAETVSETEAAECPGIIPDKEAAEESENTPGIAREADKISAEEDSEESEEHPETADQEELEENSPEAELSEGEGESEEISGTAVLEEKAGVAVNEANFPDNVFRNYIGSMYDTDKNGTLSSTEISGIKELDLFTKNISTLKGIEYFTALKSLNCSMCSLTELDISKNTKLTYLDCGHNDISTLDLSKNVSLEELYCPNMKLTKLDISALTSLKVLRCSTNSLTSLDVSMLRQLTDLRCEYNSLKKINLSANTALKKLCVRKTGLTTLNISNCVNLVHLDCIDNDITTLDITGIPVLIKAYSHTPRDFGSSYEYASNSSADYWFLAIDKKVTTVLTNAVKVTGVTLNRSSLTLMPKETASLTATVTPENAVNKAVTWSSSNTYSVKVDQNGKVTAVNAGRSIITVTTEDGGKTASCTVQVLFTDVTNKNNAAYNAVYWGVNNGYVNGYGTYFDPTSSCTRAQVVLFLWRAAGKPAPSSNTLRFKDASVIEKMAPDYKTAILWGSEKGIVMGFTSGADKGKFKPKDPCTRGQIVTFLWRFAGKPSVSGSSAGFPDVPKTHVYYSAILWAAGRGITTGFSDGNFRPDQTCTRAQCVTFLYRMLK